MASRGDIFRLDLLVYSFNVPARVCDGVDAAVISQTEKTDCSTLYDLITMMIIIIIKTTQWTAGVGLQVCARCILDEAAQGLCCR